MAQYSYNELKKLWVKAGGDPGKADMAAAVALAESGGNPKAHNGSNSNGSQDKGLWQINSVHKGLSTYDPLENAKAAVKISGNGKNWSPWVAYQNGKHEKFLQGGGKTSDGGAAGKTGTGSGTSSKPGTGGKGKSQEDEPAGAEAGPGKINPLLIAGAVVLVIWLLAK